MAKSYPVDETRSADAVERTKRQRRPNAKKRSKRAKAPKRQTRRKGAVGTRSQNQTCNQETDEATDLPRPAQPPRRCDDRRAASGDRLAATQCARLPGWGRQEEARPHAPIGEAGRGSPAGIAFPTRSNCHGGSWFAEGKATVGQARDIEVSRRLEALSDLSPDELRKEWRRLYRSQPPRLSRDLLVRAIAYRIQELRYGGLSKATSRKLAALVQARRSDGEIAPEGAQRIRAGARLVREWNGRTHTVTVEEDGFTYAGRNYRSLSAIAREITGARWSGPRFFGLAPKRGASDA